MKKNLRKNIQLAAHAGLLAIAIFFNANLKVALAQSASYPSDEGSFGWGIPKNWGGWPWGFGGATTVPGSIMDGWGVMMNGAGYYNRSAAIARSVDVNTWLHLTSAINQSQMNMNSSNYRRRLRRHARIIDARRKTFERLRDNPNFSDIKSGDAINVKMRLLMNPGYSARVAEELKVPVLPEVLDQLVFSKPSDGIFASAKDLKSITVWPMLFRQASHATLRANLESLWPRAWASLRTNGYVDQLLTNQIKSALNDLRARADADYGTVDPLAYSNARTFLDTRIKTLRAFNSEELTGFFQEIADHNDLTLGQLLESLSKRSMQFYPAADSDQVATYERLYAVLRGAPPTVLSTDTFSAVFDASDEALN